MDALREFPFAFDLLKELGNRQLCVCRSDWNGQVTTLRKAGLAHHGVQSFLISTARSDAGAAGGSAQITRVRQAFGDVVETATGKQKRSVKPGRKLAVRQGFEPWVGL